MMVKVKRPSVVEENKTPLTVATKDAPRMQLTGKDHPSISTISSVKRQKFKTSFHQSMKFEKTKSSLSPSSLKDSIVNEKMAEPPSITRIKRRKRMKRGGSLQKVESDAQFLTASYNAQANNTTKGGFGKRNDSPTKKKSQFAKYL